MRRDFVIFHFENNKIDNAVRRCLRNKTKPFYCEIVSDQIFRKVSCMRKDVSVKKCKKHRYVARFFTLLLAAFPVILVITDQQSLLALVGCLPLLLSVPMMLYYETWQIRFTAQGIEKSLFFRKTKRYSYVQLQEVTKGYYTSERDIVIRMVFTDKKAMQFRKDDENAEIAERRLQKHCSIMWGKRAKNLREFGRR